MKVVRNSIEQWLLDQGVKEADINYLVKLAKEAQISVSKILVEAIHEYVTRPAKCFDCLQMWAKE
jgi:hypothetical protein